MSSLDGMSVNFGLKNYRIDLTSFPSYTQALMCSRYCAARKRKRKWGVGVTNLHDADFLGA